VISPVHARLQNADTDWFSKARYGVINHFLYDYNDIKGDWNTIVDAFDVDAYALQCQQAGVGYVMFTLGQNSGYFCSPNATYDAYCGWSAGQRCSRRDLPLALGTALSAKGIKLMLYLPSGAPDRDLIAKEKLGWQNAHVSQSFQEKWENVIREWSLRYGDKVSGWWFDGIYAPASYQDTTAAHGFKTFAEAAKAGNAHRIVAFNPGVSIMRLSEYEDYTAGEQNNIAPPGPGRWFEGLQWHCLTYLGTFWGEPGTQNSTADLVNYVRSANARGGVVTLDIQTSKSGVWNSSQFAQLRALKDSLAQPLDSVASNRGPKTVFVNDSSSSIVYTGQWGRNTLIDNYQRDAHVARENGASCSYSFEGSSIQFVGPHAADMGDVEVQIDGAVKATVNAYSVHPYARYSLYSIDTLSAGAHTIKLTKKSGSYMIVDGFWVQATEGSPAKNANSLVPAKPQ